MSESQKKYLQHLKKHRQIVLFLRIFILILFLFLWELTARLGMINSFILSSPSGIANAFCDLYTNGSLPIHIGITLAETFGSFALVAVFSLIFALLLWWNRTFCEIFDPYLVVLNSLPKSAMAPIFIVWLGNNIKTIVVTAISVAIFGSILNLYSCFIQTDPDKLKLIRTLGGTKFHCLTKVILPMNLSTIISIFKVDIGLCLIGVVIGEFLAAKQGLGYLIIYASQTFRMDWVMLSILLLCVIAIIIYQGITLLEKRIH